MAIVAMQAEYFKPAIHWRQAVDHKHASAAGYKTLAAAVVRRAIRDAAGLNMPHDLPEAGRAELRADAVEWLTDDNARNICELAGIDHALIMRWIRAGCPNVKGGIYGNK